ncbi:MAG: SUMF1/EgtB/PvdO family nonheme iron enzyme [Treponema sp.]|nr:SUMF1/EgtB/PvdO family nonheme iron enzyme [Treponema sp.]
MYLKKALLFWVVLSAVPALWAQQKYALVIGNANYTGISKLNNPVNDANDMEAVLKSLGFTVDKVLNGSTEQMETAIQNLKRRLGGSRNTYGFFFYAGHGVQSNGENYLIPVNADNILNDTHLRTRTVSLQFILDSFDEARNELNMIVLDACRDNPFSWARSGSRGLSVVGRAPPGSIVMYATSANSTAADGTGRNGLFSGHLLTNLKAPGLSVFDIFDKTMGDVSRVTNGKQQPELSLRFSGAASTYLGSQPSPTPRPVSGNMVWVEGGTFLMGSDAGYDNEKPVHQVTVKGFYISKYQVTQAEWAAVMGSNPSKFRGDTHPVEMVEWMDVIEFCNKLSIKEGLTPCYSGSKDNITCDWNANGYRLPTEAEWEYAAHGGANTYLKTLFAGSNSVDAVAWYSGNSGSRTHPVGTKAPNGLGLYDMSGNVWEWCWDCYTSYSSGAQLDPWGMVSSEYGHVHIIRGGSWEDAAQHVRSTLRNDSFTPTMRLISIGFRVVRSRQ